MSPRVSVVIPAHNGEATLPSCLEALSAQDLPQAELEVIVVDDRSTDRTAEIARSFGVRLVQAASGGAGAARNSGAREARADHVAFTDCDCVASRSWLRLLLAAATCGPTGPDEPSVGAAGRTLGFPAAGDAARFVDLARGFDAERHLMHPRFPFAPSGNVLYRRDVFESVGGFDERFDSYEACDLHARLGRTRPFRYEPRAVVLHRHRGSWADYWRQQRGYGRGFAQFYLRYAGEVRWSAAHELREVARLALLACGAARPGRGDAALVRRGTFVKELAQRVGFVGAYWSPRERRRW